MHRAKRGAEIRQELYQSLAQGEKVDLFQERVRLELSWVLSMKVKVMALPEWPKGE